MLDEMKYSQLMGINHIKKYGQYFTHYKIADFMCAWACSHAQTMLDPAIGNSIFFLSTQKYNEKCSMTGYELDSAILKYFGNPSSAHIIYDNYLLSDWDNKYDAIVCNPPYNKFQNIPNRNIIFQEIFKHSGITCNGYTNLYILFLIKSIFQLTDKGKLAYLVPTEFMNSQYGTEIKQLLIDRQLLHSIINFKNNQSIFFNATTTCCILLLDNSSKNAVNFYNIDSINELSLDIFHTNNISTSRISYERLMASKKWRFYIHNEKQKEYKNLKSISSFCSVSRGIATGDNSFFCFSLPKAQKMGIPEEYLIKCICKSADIKEPIFNIQHFNMLSNAGKTVYLLDAMKEHQNIFTYIKQGEIQGVHKKYLPAHRSPWYSLEKKSVAPIWVSSACRGTIKFVRNLTMAKTLTTFHSIFINPQYTADTDLIFSYFLTSTAQMIIRENRKELGNSLDKFQPNDLNTAKMIDITLLSLKDRLLITKIYKILEDSYSSDYVEELDSIFKKYILI